MFQRGSVWLAGLLFLGFFLTDAGAADLYQQWLQRSQDLQLGYFQSTILSGRQVVLQQQLDSNGQHASHLVGGVARGLVIDPQGNMIVSGYARNHGSDKVHLLKCTPDGRVIWDRTQTLGPAGRAMDVASNAQGDVYVAGYTVSRPSNYQLLKFNAQGALQWQRLHSEGGQDQAQAVTVDPGGNVIITGSSAKSGTDVLTLKYGPQGNLIWKQRFNGGDADWAWGVSSGPNGEIYVVGSTMYAGQRDVLLLKYNAAGQLLWKRRLDFGAQEVATAVAAHPDGSVAVVGYSERSAGSDMLILMLNEQGQSLWTQRESASAKDRAFGVAWTPSDDIVVTGSTMEHRVETTYTLRITASGERLWARTEPGAHDARGYDVQADKADNIYVVSSDGTGYRTIQYRNGFVPSGVFQTQAHQFQDTVRFKTLGVEAQLNGQTVVAVVESSTDAFRSVAGSVRLTLQPGQTHYSLRALKPGKFVRVRFELATRSSMSSPALNGLSIMASK